MTRTEDEAALSQERAQVLEQSQIFERLGDAATANV
jgi:hypothetical protein